MLFALFVAELPFGRAATFVCCVFLTILAVVKLGMLVRSGGGRAGPVSLFVPVAIGSWHVSLADSFADITPVAIPVIAIVMAAMMQVVQSNEELALTRAQLARLAAENERSRIARDLHDLLGHSLTTITVKAGLARSIGATDPGRALTEIAEVEALARRSLADVRAAVSGYHDVTLNGELAAGRELLRAAGITADLPRATDVVDPAHHELFGWVVREGLTNVVRHARATLLCGPAVHRRDRDHRRRRRRSGGALPRRQRAVRAPRAGHGGRRHGRGRPGSPARLAAGGLPARRRLAAAADGAGR